MKSLLETLSSLSTPLILVAAALHLVFFAVLWWWYRRDLRSIASALDSFTRALHHRSVLESHQHLADQVDAFLVDVQEILENPSRQADRELLRERINILDEKRPYLNALWFETK